MANTTIDILAQELQIKQRRLNKYRDKIYEQQDVLKDKIKRINELKEQLKNLDGEWQAAAHFALEYKAKLEEKDEKISYLEGFIKAKEDKIIRLEDELKHAKEELSYSRGEHPIQKAADRKRRNGKSKSRNIN